ncbi:MAG: SRPBCC domain-containing protein [Chlamydiales bacterium]|nr:SRPBCC domain-containing protein [Chlamydiales bacterium]
MYSIKTEITIDASASKVWNVLLDFDNYPKWSRFIESIKGSPNIDETLNLQIAPSPSNKAMHFYPKVIKKEEKKSFAWLGKLWGLGFLFSGKHYLHITPLGQQQCLLRHGEEFSGWLLPLIWKTLKKNTKEGFINFNKSIKQQSELQEDTNLYV